MGVENKDLFRAGLFSPRMVNRIVGSSPRVIDQTNASLQSLGINSGSFRFHSPGDGLSSTQQLPVDFAKFENHTFFNSAEVKVNVTFDKIINEYPFDGEKEEVEEFFDDLTGFEKYVFDQFPKSRNFLWFSGSEDFEEGKSEKGSYIKVSDHAGILKPTLSKDKTGETIIDPGLESISFEMHLFLPKIANKPQVIVQKLSSSYDLGSRVDRGITVGLEKTSSTSDVNLCMIVTCGSNNVLTASMNVEKGGFRHVCCVFDRNSSHNVIRLYQSGNLMASSSIGNIGLFNFANNPLYLGTGSQHLSQSSADGDGNTTFNPQQTFSGAMDEFRVFHDARSSAEQKAFQLKNIFATGSLKLYYRFNEPTGSYQSNNIVLDSSGKSLHSTITNFSLPLREDSGIPPLTQSIKNELAKFNPVLFPTFTDLILLNSKLLSSASTYDVSNPNLITKLIPPHYLSQESFAQGFANETADVGKLYSTGSEPFPGGGRLNSGQIIATLLFLWAKFFDEIKMYIDYFGEMRYVDYSETEGIPSPFLPFLAASEGFILPSVFNNPTAAQFLEGEDLLADTGHSGDSLKTLQDRIWRRVLTGMKDIIQSKGTIYSIKALFRSAGIEPDKSFVLREFGGAIARDIFSDLAPRRDSVEQSTMLDMSGGLTSVSDPETVNVQGFHAKLPRFISPFLSGTRYEVGFPEAQGPMNFMTNQGVVSSSYFTPHAFHGISTDVDDGLFTSGSWTYESFYQFSKPSGSLKHFVTQSLVRLESSASVDHYKYPWLAFNLVALSSSNKYIDTGSVRLYGRPTSWYVSPGGVFGADNSASPFLNLVLTGVDIFDGNKWHVSFGKQRNDEIGSLYSSSYFLRVAKPLNGGLGVFATTSSLLGTGAYKAHAGGAKTHTESEIDPWTNSRGYFAVIGSQSIVQTQPNQSNAFLNKLPNSDTSKEDIKLQARVTNFSGKFGHLRFWSKALTETETVEHARNFKSLGVKDPLTNFNFSTTPSGSFGKLRLNISTDQFVTESNSSGELALIDFSQQFHASESISLHNQTIVPGMAGVEPSSRIIKPAHFAYSFFNPRFDERGTTNKVRIRSFQEEENIKRLGGMPTPVYEVPPSEVIADDTRFSIEASVCHALDEDIIKIFATLEKFNDYIGRPELLFSDNYRDLRNLRNVYFNRLTGKISIKAFFEIFRWLDDSFGMLVERLLPSKTNFLGMNFIIESHVLERTKFRYNYIGAEMPANLLLRKGVSQIDGPGWNEHGQDQSAYAFSANEENSAYDNDPNTLDLIIVPG